MKKVLLLVAVFGWIWSAAQAPEKWNSNEIYAGIEKLNFLGSALYLAAHPDDENTRLISYLSNDVKAHTAYLSLTRGDGGQNLIGAEIRELLGVIRTQELLGARGVDGGQQFFSRANDFGFSKHPDETLKIWNRDEVMSDVVWVIRNFRPDVIVNRFDHRTPGRSHGHHTSSAMLSVESYELTGDKAVYPAQLKHVEPWQPRRIFFNTSWWFYGSREKFAEADKSRMVSVDVGTYYPLRGQSNNEIAALSRTMHKSQGFGSTGSRGSYQEYLELIEGDMPANNEDLFDGINTTWSRVEGGAPLVEVFKVIQAEYDFKNPAASLPRLMLAYNMINELPDASYWKHVKLAELKQVIAACAGLYLEAVADDYTATVGEEIELTIEAINRSSNKIELTRFSIEPLGIDSTANMELENNQSYKFFRSINLPQDLPVTNSYWLNKPWVLGMYTVEEQQERGKPQTERLLKVNFELTIDGVAIDFERDLVFKKNDPVDGEVYRPFEITQPVFSTITDKVYVFTENKAQTIDVKVRAGKANIAGQLHLKCPIGWQFKPATADFKLALKGEETTISFELYPPKDAQSADWLTPVVTLDGIEYTQELVEIEHDHIPTQLVVRPARSKVVKVELAKKGERVAYLMGAGDDIPSSLQQMGYQVDELDDDQVTLVNLQTYDAVVLGVRAYNTVERLQFHQPILLQYVEQGGTMIVQYNTTRSLKVPSAEIGPYPFKLSRDRVTVEEAEVRFLAPEHPVLNTPNKITTADFDGWVQERGLYFPNEWDDKYTAILSANDEGETPKDGGLLVAQYGKGHYIYTGYSWFRELPAGVPGAYRLFANMLSIGKE